MKTLGHRANHDRQNKGKATGQPSRPAKVVAKPFTWIPPALQDEEDEHMAGSYFYGFKVGGRVADEVLKTILVHRDRVQRATWTDESKLHVTVKFVGKTLPANVDQEFQRVCVQASAFKLSLKGAGTFNNRSGPRVLFAQLDTGIDHVKLLHKELGGTEHFSPHLTLAKLEDIGDAAPEFAVLAQEFVGVSFGTCLVDELALYQTQGDGKPYKVVSWHRLLG